MATVASTADSVDKKISSPFWLHPDRLGIPYHMLRFYPDIKHGQALRLRDKIKWSKEHGHWVDEEVSVPAGAPCHFGIEVLKQAYAYSADNDAPIIEGIIQAVGEDNLPPSWVTKARKEAPYYYAPEECKTGTDLEAFSDPDAERRKELLKKVSKKGTKKQKNLKDL